MLREGVGQVKLETKWILQFSRKKKERKEGRKEERKKERKKERKLNLKNPGITYTGNL